MSFDDSSIEHKNILISAINQVSSFFIKMENQREKIEVLQLCRKLLRYVGLYHENGLIIGTYTIPKRIVRFSLFILLILITISLLEYCFGQKFELRLTCGALCIFIICIQTVINYFYFIIKDGLICRSIEHLQFIVNESNI